MKEITDYWGGWFAGFTDGEGCFTITKNHRNTPCTAYGCQFQIGLRDDDRQILNEIHDTFRIGTIYNRPARTNNGNNTQASTEFKVNAITECAELVKVFEKYPLRAKKRQDFEIWKQAIAELQTPIACRNADLLEYYFLKIKEVKQYKTEDELTKPRIKSLQLTIFLLI